mmetsp:Transcript_3170/g.4675  ORF Transcript_3170/g.4675 Transcript_3170/m.4675 type:complete len:126 (+) Transcript_3170:1-378(+)
MNGLYGLSALKHLDLSFNMYGFLEETLGNLSELEYLDFESNIITGLLPSSLMKMTNLVHLNVQGNRLEGQFPSTLTDLSSLRLLDLSLNFLSGGIPDLDIFVELGEIEYRGFMCFALMLLSCLSR